MYKKVISEIMALLFGHKYYVNIINTRGTSKCEASSFIFLSKEAAKRHREELESNLSYKYIETVAFRSRHDYTNLSTFKR